MNEKIKNLRNKLNSINLQGMIVTNELNIQYLTGIKAEGTLLITRKENVYITDSRYIEAVNSQITIDDEIIIYDSRNVSKYDYECFFALCENVGFEESNVTYKKYKKLLEKYKVNLIETEDIIEKLRIIKNEDEIEYTKKACLITDNCFLHLQNFIKLGMTEKEIALEIERYFKLNGADGLAFDTIVASGPNSSMPHAVPTDRRIEAGDVIVIDFGCKYNGYCSDMTRTVFAKFIPESVKEVYELVLENQKYVLGEIKDMANIKIITNIVENSFKLKGYMQLHALGHGVGLEVHETPVISLNNNDYLRENMIVTDEPGIYVLGKYGVRIEDTILVRKNDCRSLTLSPKEYVIVG